MTDAVRVIVAGACGRMGRTLVECAVQDGRFEVVGATERRDHASVGRPLSEVMGIATLEGVVLSAALGPLLADADVVLEFTTPSASMADFELATEYGKGIVIGTTGFSDEELAEIQRGGDVARCVLSPNMSRGMNVMFVLAGVLGSVLEDFDAEIVESHHRGKKDSPSGSALQVARSLAASRRVLLEDVAVYGRHGKELIRRQGEIGIHSVRAGETVGEHTLVLSGQGERFEITHRAASRRAFAAGALLAAEFVAKAEPGIYSMAQVLGLDALSRAAAPHPGGTDLAGKAD
ncbi:MAG TPA: 4-hydroxy-tetrahydrodipicolinate reductase [bacterium]|nr:4-hydroxy-tetrahydrodipicolinate reductase [bacterium]